MTRFQKCILTPILAFFIFGNLLAKEREFSQGHKFVFFAVVEGLYNEGLSNSSMEAILGTELSDNFVYSCPICTPAYDAFLLFKSRPNLSRKKKVIRDFGTGLKVKERKALAGEPKERRAQIRALTSRWIEARFERMSLPNEEEKRLREELKKMSEQGTKILEKLKNAEHGEHMAEVYKDWEFCPFCEGTTLHEAASGSGKNQSRVQGD